MTTTRDLAQIANLLATTTGADHKAIAAYAEGAATAAWATGQITLELDDPDDPMAVDLGGPCSICGAPVAAQTGVCEGGHDDLDRADLAESGGVACLAVVDHDGNPAGYVRAGGGGWVTDPDEPFCPAHDWPLACTGQRAPGGALVYRCPEGEVWHLVGYRLYHPAED